MKKFSWLVPAFLGCLLAVVSCTSYKSRVVPFRHPSAYSNMQMVAGAQVAAEAYADPGKAKKVFGFNIRERGSASGTGGDRQYRLP